MTNDFNVAAYMADIFEEGLREDPRNLTDQSIRDLGAVFHEVPDVLKGSVWDAFIAELDFRGIEHGHIDKQRGPTIQ